MSDDDDRCLHLNIHDLHNNAASDDDSNTASIGSSTRLSDDSGIEDWSDDMTVQTELQQPLRDEKHSNSPIVELLNASISPIKDEATMSGTECIFPMLPDLYSVHEAKAADTKQDVLSDDAVQGVVGLYNLGNTCFMNAALQCLFVTRSLKDLVREGNILQNGSDHMDEPANVLLFVERFQELFQKVLAGKYSLLRPDQFHNSVARLHPTLGDYKQHDSQEFISFLLNTLHELMNRGRGKLRIHNTDQNNGSSSSDCSDSISGDVSMKRLKMDNDVDDSATMEPDAGVDCEENVSKAEGAWRAYTADNQSQIIDSFHGQFQSVIICDKCSFISTTYEPFMSLSLPIPHAMEKQLIITWVPSLKLSALPGMLSAIKYCITVSKNATCGDLKSAFLAQRRKADDQLQADHIVLVEAKQSANVSVLDDRTLISYITKSKDIYAIEVVQSSDNTPSLVADIFVDDVSNGTSNGVSDENDIASTYLNGHMDSGMVTPDENITNIDNVKSTSHMDISDSFDNNNNGVDGSSCAPEAGFSGGGSVEGAATWHSCGICLEEIFDEELRVHLVCGGLLCDPCLANMIEVLNSDRFPCPICNRYISKEDYTSLVEPKQNGTDSNGVKKEVVRQILVPVMFRHDLSGGSNSLRKFQLFGHPVVCSLPSQVETSAVFEVVSQVLKNVCFTPRKFDVVLTDGTGLSCGVCDLFSSCTGCCLKDDGSKEELLKLKPGCCISVHFHEDIEPIVKTLSFFQEDASMNRFRDSDTVSLEECLAKFGDTEVLTKDNPWYCTKCQTNQIAVKNMTVTRWPDTLLIHLKRFYFEGNQCCKIECPVVFPLEGLNIDVLTCADGNVESPTYNLYSFICHSGTLFGGHYTAHAKTSMEAEWNYFNDESFDKMDPPTAEENQKAYVLFYQRKGTM